MSSSVAGMSDAMTLVPTATSMRCGSAAITSTPRNPNGSVARPPTVSATASPPWPGMSARRTEMPSRTERDSTAASRSGPRNSMVTAAPSGMREMPA